MTQKEFDEQFVSKYPSQVEVQDYMVEGIDKLRSIFKSHDLSATKRQIMVFWESYSDFMDGSWLSAADKRREQEVKDFVEDAIKWWEMHPYRPQN